MATFTAEDGEAIYALHARSIITNFLKPAQHAKPTSLSLAKPIIPSPPKATDVVGILGAGVGGLYTALMLESLKINFEILEASEDRVGGRMYTHKFDKGGRYDYYDVGAMRFPLPPKKNGQYQQGVMQRLGLLFQYLEMEDQLIPYYFKAKPCTNPGIMYFNGIHGRVDQKDVHFDADKLGINSTLIGLGVPRVVQDVIGPFAQMLYNDMKEHTTTGWDVMMRNDAYSTRAYMSFKYMPSATFGLVPDHFSTREINWCETFDKSSGWYDKALTETVLEAIAFGEAGDAHVEWKCIDGGSSVLPENMKLYLYEHLQKDVITMNARVIAIKEKAPENEPPCMVVTTADGKDHEYAHVISTIPIPVLRTIDLTGSNLDIVQSNALRQLQYGPSIKVGILFKETWWTTGKNKRGELFNIVGGQSYTDLPIRTIVYPSYGVDTDTPSKTLIASYCWTDDASRMGSLINTGEKTYEAQLEKLVLNNLAEVHEVTYEYLKELCVEVFAWDWNHDPLTMGAFAFFGPGNFQDMYTSLSRPAANDKLHFAGEALSVRHAWVVGALDSAWRAVHSYLEFTDPARLQEFFEKWGKNPDWFDPEPSKGPIPSGPRYGSIFEQYLHQTHK